MLVQRFVRQTVRRDTCSVADDARSAAVNGEIGLLRRRTLPKRERDSESCMTDRYLPTSIDELAGMLEGRVLVEDHFVDFKKDLEPGSGANKGLSKDIAAFSIDGGRIFIGVDEQDRDSGNPPIVSPVRLSGLKERIDQIARTAVDPPVAVRCLEIRSDDPKLGVLIVTVPPSSEPPHMADGKPRGRSDTTNYVLSSAEVTALYERRARSAQTIDALLDAEIERDPTPEQMREFGHVFVVAQPINGNDEMFLDSLEDEQFHQWFNREVVGRAGGSVASPDVAQAGSRSRRAHGWAAHHYCISPERTTRPNGEHPAREDHLIDIEIREDGGVRFFSGRATDRRSDRDVILEAVIATAVLRTIQAATAIADSTGYFGNWHLGVAANGLHGRVSHAATERMFGDGSAYSEDLYRRTGTFGYDDLAAVAPVLTRLVAPLLRGLRSNFDLTQFS
jgi:hypothetical protein